MTCLNSSKIRNEFAAVLNRVVRRGERIVVRRSGKDVAALVSLEDLDILRKIEDRLDNEAADKALKDPHRIPWEKLKKDLGLT